MREDCKRAMEHALGHPVTAAQARDADGRIASAMTQAARHDIHAWRALTRSEQYIEGGRLAGEELKAEEAKKKQRLGDAIILAAKNERFILNQINQGLDAGATAELKAMTRVLVAKSDGRNSEPPIESMANGYNDDAVRRLQDVFDAVRPRLFDSLQRPELQSQMRRALAGIKDGIDPLLIKAAETYKAVAGEFREAFNAAGGVIGKLENWDQTHPWSARKTMNAYDGHGADARRMAVTVIPEQRLALRREMDAKALDGYIKDYLPALNRRMYVHDNGSAWTDGEAREFLTEAFKSVTTGMSKDPSPSNPGGAIKANRHSAHRQIHLLPEYVEPLLKKYTEGNVLDAMTNHVHQMSRDLAIVQRLGANADAQWKTMVKRALQNVRSNDRWAMAEARRRADGLQKLYDHIAGNDAPPPLNAIADTLGAYRALKSGAVLGKAVWTSITDHPIEWAAAISGGLDPFKVELNSALGWAPKSRRYLKRLGLLTETSVGYAQRYAQDDMSARGVSSRVSSFMLRKSGINFVTELRRSGYAVTMMDAIGSLTRRKTSMNDLHGNDRLILMGKGIDQATWNIWRAAKLEKYGINGSLLTPDAIMSVDGPSFEAKRKAVAILLGSVKEDTDIAVVQPGARERVQMAGGTQAGTVGGELMRTAALFKSFPWAFFQRHVERAQRYDSTVGRIAYLGSLMIGTTMFGCIAKTIADMIEGKNPPDFNPFSEHGVSNIVSGTAKGGGLGIFGDFLFNEINPSLGQGAASYIGGPLMSDTDTVARIGSNLWQAGVGGNEPDNTGMTPQQKAEIKSVQLAKGLIPGSTLWYTKALTDRYIYNALLEEIDPNYLQAMKARQQSQQGTTYFADPDAQPGFDGSHWDRPDIGTAWAQ